MLANILHNIQMEAYLTIFNKNRFFRRNDSSSAPSAVRGFTLAEIMIVVVLLSIIIASMIPTFLVFSRGMNALGNYSSMSADSRKVVEYFARDVHMAENVLYRNSKNDQVRLQLPNGEIEYQRVGDEFIRKQVPGTERILLSNVTELEILFYERVNSERTDDINEAKLIKLTATLSKDAGSNGANTTQTDKIISAKFQMRNKR